MRQVGVLVAGNIREALRDKLLLSMLAAGILMLLLVALMAPLNLGARDKTFHDLGLAWMHLSSMLILLVLGAWTLHQEREKGIWLAVLTRPVSRMQFLLGRLLGLIATLAITILCGLAIFIIVGSLTGIAPLPGVWLAALFIFLEMSLLAGLLLFFTSFSGFAVTVFMSLAIFFAGHMSSDLLRAAVLTQNSAVSGLLMFFNWLLPHMELFRIRASLVGGDLPGGAELLRAGVYAVLYVGALFAAAAAIFSRQELK